MTNRLKQTGEAMLPLGGLTAIIGGVKLAKRVAIEAGTWNDWHTRGYAGLAVGGLAAVAAGIDCIRRGNKDDTEPREPADQPRDTDT